MTHWQWVDGEIVRGHGVAGGSSAETPYPGGSISLQTPFFLDRGLDLTPFHPATINVSIAPYTFEMVAPAVTLRDVAWIDLIPPESFSFSPVRLQLGDRQVEALVYYPHPETKIHHFQSASLIELLAPYVAGVAYGNTVRLGVNSAEIKLVKPQ